MGAILRGISSLHDLIEWHLEEERRHLVMNEEAEDSER